ncbi:unnamed protein product [Moneuplotes crassus]|uniref:Uncharacterized protein n=1 Tax=Euplotes crassus TaxID=5936 RepID=A0AAD1X634_EUPCR|nr:unnamed protein product [Moneuplotes crassus]
MEFDCWLIVDKEKKSVLIKMRNSSSNKDRVSLSSYAKSQKSQYAGIKHPPASARLSKRVFNNKMLLTGSSIQNPTSKRKNSESNRGGDSGSKSRKRPMTKGSIRGSVKSDLKSTKDFQIRKHNNVRNAYPNREGKIASGYDFATEQSEPKNLDMQRDGLSQSDNMYKNLPSRKISGLNDNQDYLQSSDGFKILQTSKMARPQTAKYDGIKIPITSVNGKTLVKVPEDNLEVSSQYWKHKTIHKSSSAAQFSPQLLHQKQRNIHTSQGARGTDNFIKRIEKRAISATRGLRTTYKEKKLKIDLKAKYKMLIMNWGKELEKHDKILEKFHIFTPLKYDIDATFHKLFSNKSKGLIKQKLVQKRKGNLMKAGYLENEIDLMFENDPNAKNANHNVENQDLLLGSKYEEGENKEELEKIENSQADIINLKSPQPKLPDMISQESVEKIQPQTVEKERDNDLKPKILVEEILQEDEHSNPLISQEKEDLEGIKSVENLDKTPIKIRDHEEEDFKDVGSAYSSPFKNNADQLENSEQFTTINNKFKLEEDFLDKDIQMRIRDKDVVFIYEIDDIIKEITSSKKLKPLDEHPEILDTLNRFSKLFRHYIRYRVVDIGDLMGGLFLDGFWKTLLITMDNILQSIDERFKRRVVKLQDQFAKVIEKMNKKLEDKDKEMRAMDQTEYIEALKERLDLIKKEKLSFQKLAQDKLDFIEMLTSNDKKYPGFTDSKDLYDTARELIESLHLERKNRTITVHKLEDIFDTGKKIRETQNVEIQTEMSCITPLKVKEIILPSLDDHQIMESFSHPFSGVFKFLNQDTVEFPKKLDFNIQPMSKVFITSEEILNTIGTKLLEYSQNYEIEMLSKNKKKKSPRGRSRSPKRKKKKGKGPEFLDLSFLRINPNYPTIETIYLQQFCDQNERGKVIENIEESTMSKRLRTKEITFRTLSTELYQYCYSLSLYPNLYSSKMLSMKTGFLNNETVIKTNPQRNTRSEYRQIVKQLFLQLRIKFLQYAKEKEFLAEKDLSDPEINFPHNDIINFLREYLKDFRPLCDMIISQMSTYIFRVMLPKVPEGEGEGEPEAEGDNHEETKNENKDENREGGQEGEQQEEENQEPQLPSDLQEEIDDQDDDSNITDPLEIKKRFLFRCICIQLYNSDLQISKKLHQFFDPEKKGYCSMQQCIFTLLNYYKIVMLPSDLELVLNDFIIKEQELESPEDLLNADFDSKHVNRVDFNVFLQEVTRPYVFQVSKKELFISYHNFMTLLIDCINDLIDTCKDALGDLFLNDMKESEINSYDSFTNFLCEVLGEEYKVPNEDCCHVFVNTFSANKSIISDANFQPPSEDPEYSPLKIKPVEDEAEGEDEEGEEKEKDDPKLHTQKSQLNFGKLVAKATEYSSDLSKGNEIPRALEFSRQCEIVFLKHFGFKYIMNPKILGKHKDFSQIFEFIARESTGLNVVKKKRPRSPKRKKSPKNK